MVVSKKTKEKNMVRSKVQLDYEGFNDTKNGFHTKELRKLQTPIYIDRILI